MWEPITGQGKPTPDANLARLDLFIAMAWSDNCSSSPSRRLFNWICLCWQNCFAHWVCLSSSVCPLPPSAFSLALSSSLPPSAGPGVYLRAMGKGEANDSQWLLISTICSALGPLISERKSNMWRESDRQKLSLANRPIVCWRSAFKHEGPSNSFSSRARYETLTYLCIDLCRSQLLLLICAAMESKYFITFSNKQWVWAREVSSILWKERWRPHSITP